MCNAVTMVTLWLLRNLLNLALDSCYCATAVGVFQYASRMPSGSSGLMICKPDMIQRRVKETVTPAYSEAKQMRHDENTQQTPARISAAAASEKSHLLC